MMIQECAQLDKDGKPWIQTASGHPFPIGDPKPEDFKLEDIAHHLSRLNRYTGAIKFECYSVAEHSVRVAYYLRDLAWRERRQCSNAFVQMSFRVGLMHDAHEAYLNDLNSPLKRHLLNRGHVGYHYLAEQYDETLADRFCLHHERHDLLREADLSVLDLERPRVMGPPPRPWTDLGSFEKVKPKGPEYLKTWGWRPNLARRRFLLAAKSCGLVP